MRSERDEVSAGCAAGLPDLPLPSFLRAPGGAIAAAVGTAHGGGASSSLCVRRGSRVCGGYRDAACTVGVSGRASAGAGAEVPEPGDRGGEPAGGRPGPIAGAEAVPGTGPIGIGPTADGVALILFEGTGAMTFGCGVLFRAGGAVGRAAAEFCSAGVDIVGATRCVGTAGAVTAAGFDSSAGIVTALVVAGAATATSGDGSRWRGVVGAVVVERRFSAIGACASGSRGRARAAVTRCGMPADVAKVCARESDGAASAVLARGVRVTRGTTGTSDVGALRRVATLAEVAVGAVVGSAAGDPGFSTFLRTVVARCTGAGRDGSRASVSAGLRGAAVSASFFVADAGRRGGAGIGGSLIPAV